MKSLLRLKDLIGIESNSVDYSVIMTELCGYKNYKIGRLARFTRKFRQAQHMVSEIASLDPTKIPFIESKIKKPKNIDSITFRAMMEVQSLLGESPKEKDTVELIAEVIAVVCYSVNNPDKKYDSDTSHFKAFRETILNETYLNMLGLYNAITEDLNASRRMWEQRFISVDISDPDYEKANGYRMNQFNVINTIKSVCNDFNVTYDEAWQLSYALTQTNSYSKATYNHIQEQMRIIKEAKMKQSRRNT